MSEKHAPDFISIASHQLRTPLTAIKWYADILLSGKADTLQPQQREYVMEIYHATERMVRLVDNLLIVDQAKENKLPIVIRSTSIVEILQRVTEEYQTVAKAQRVALIVDCNPHQLPLIKIDPIYVRMALKNLIDNALRFTLRGGTVTVACQSDKKQILITISDTGIGIPKEEQSRVFGKFFRSSNSSEIQTEGTGLGLYIAKVIIEHNRGKLWFESTPIGTTFYISFPLGETASIKQ
jgi:signal transduction histidine kinase